MTDLPDTLDAALSPAFLNATLPARTGAGRIISVDELARVQDVAIKPKIVRFRAN